MQVFTNDVFAFFSVGCCVFLEPWDMLELFKDHHFIPSEDVIDLFLGLFDLFVNFVDVVNEPC